MGADAGAARTRLSRDRARRGGGASTSSVYAPSRPRTIARSVNGRALLPPQREPGAALALLRMNTRSTSEHVLPAIRVPALILHRTGDATSTWTRVATWRSGSPAREFVELPGRRPRAWWSARRTRCSRRSRSSSPGCAARAEPDRVLATVLFTDIVGSTETRRRDSATGLGRRCSDATTPRCAPSSTASAAARWTPRAMGFLPPSTGRRAPSAAPGPSREPCAVSGSRSGRAAHRRGARCAATTSAGIAVHIGARVAALAGAGEVLVSNTVKDLVAGSGIVFEDAGEHVLKGVPDLWHLYRVVGLEGGGSQDPLRHHAGGRGRLPGLR